MMYIKDGVVAFGCEGYCFSEAIKKMIFNPETSLFSIEFLESGDVHELDCPAAYEAHEHIKALNICLFGFLNNGRLVTSTVVPMEYRDTRQTGGQI